MPPGRLDGDFPRSAHQDCSSPAAGKMPSLPQGALEQSFGESSRFGRLEPGESSIPLPSCTAGSHRQNPALGPTGASAAHPALLTSTPLPPLILLTQNQGRRRGSAEVRKKHIFGNSKATFSSNTPATKKISFRQILYL